VARRQRRRDNNDRLTTDTCNANGNTTSSAGISNTYDFENWMLTHVGVKLVYDGDGNHVSETGGTTTKFLVDDHNPTGLPQVLDEIVSGSVTRAYAYGLQRISENQLVNVRFLTNTSGAITDSYDYDVFGMPIRTSGTTPNVFLYSAERLDNNIGLYDLRARYYNHYNQATGRFWARDPVEGGPKIPISNATTVGKNVAVRALGFNRIHQVSNTSPQLIQQQSLGNRKIL